MDAIGEEKAFSHTWFVGKVRAWAIDNIRKIYISVSIFEIILVFLLPWYERKGLNDKDFLPFEIVFSSFTCCEQMLFGLIRMIVFGIDWDGCLLDLNRGKCDGQRFLGRTEILFTELSMAQLRFFHPDFGRNFFLEETYLGWRTVG